MRVFPMVLLCLSLATRSAAQFVSPEVQEAGNRVAERILKEGRHLVPVGCDISVRARDGMIYHWSVYPSDTLDYSTLAKDIGSSEDDGRAILLAWAESLQAQLMKLTAAAVAASGDDSEFNPETDVRLYLFARAPKTLQSGAFRAYFSISFTGSRRHEVLDENGRTFRRPSGDPGGGEITVAVTPDRRGWKPGESLTGWLTITNTGNSRVPLPVLWGDRVSATDPAGKAATPIFFNG